jgi:hypothetical protein
MGSASFVVLNDEGKPPMVRPPDGPVARTERVIVRLTPGELRQLDQHANGDRSAYLRELLRKAAR